MATAANLTSADATAIIDGALLGASQGKPLSESLPPSETPVQPGPLPTDEPIVEDEADLTPEQKKERKEQEKIRQAQENMLGKEEAERIAEEQRKQREREQTLIGLADKALQASKGAASSAGVRIANMPTLGGIMFPLILLILFGFILITYGTHTRFQWLWLVLTGNASVTGAQGSVASFGTPSSSTPGSVASFGATGGGPPNPAQETPIAAMSFAATTSGGMYGSPFS